MHRDGRMTTLAQGADLNALIAELDGATDAEHPDVAVSHESGWTLNAFASGLVVWENVEGDGPSRHRPSLTRDEVRQLLELLARGDVQAVESFGWQAGYSR
jgi:hypothetical protein